MVAPLNLRVSDIESSQVTVHWDAVSYESIMGEMKEYKVCVLEKCMLSTRIEQDAAFVIVDYIRSEQCSEEILQLQEY